MLSLCLQEKVKISTSIWTPEISMEKRENHQYMENWNLCRIPLQQNGKKFVSKKRISHQESKMTGQKSELKFPSLLALVTRLQIMIDYFGILLLEILKTNVVSWHFLWSSVSLINWSSLPGVRQKYRNCLENFEYYDDDNTRTKLSKGDSTDTLGETKLLCWPTTMLTILTMLTMLTILTTTIAIINLTHSVSLASR